MNASKKKLIIQGLIMGIFIILCIIATIYLYPIIKRMNTDELFRDEFKNKIASFGFFGILLLLLCFIIQNVLAVIPTAPFEIIAGLLYGTFGGIAISLIGSTLGSLVVILLVHLFGENFVKYFANIEDKKKFKFVNDPKRTEVIMFSILFMPGIPKDFLSFFVPFTKVKTLNFLVINLIARTPSVIISALFGNSLVNGHLTLAIVLFAIAAVISILGIVFNKQIVNFINHFNKNKTEE